MNNNYQYVGEPLIAQIAEELIIEKYSGQTVKKQEIVEPVVSSHEERGGLPSEAQNVVKTILTALQNLQTNGVAEHIAGSYWRICPSRNYRYFGVPLMPGIAEELIMELFSGQTVRRQEIVEAVVQIHEERGGLPSKSQNVGQTILAALRNLQTNEVAKYNSSDGWQISERTIGSGENWVYLYYFPSHRETVESQGESVWRCKIGKTDDDDPYRRVESQTRSAPERHIIGLLIRTDASDPMEKAIHAILRGRRVGEAPGTEWFITNPSEVEEIHAFIVAI